MYRITCLALALALGLAAQTQVDLRRESKTADFSGANSTKPMSTGPALPATCGAGQMYFLTTAPAGQNVYGCVSTNIWALQAGMNAANPVFTGTMSGPGITLTGITGSTQCLEANSSGTVIATGVPCGSGGGGGSWGSITGTLSNQTDLQNVLNLTEKTANKNAASGYAGLTSGSLLNIGEFPAFTGDCATSPGAVTLICTKTNGTAFGSLATASTSGTSLLKGNGSGGVANAVSNTDYLPVANPAFTGTLTGGAMSGTTAAFTGNLTVIAPAGTNAVASAQASGNAYAIFEMKTDVGGFQFASGASTSSAFTGDWYVYDETTAKAPLLLQKTTDYLGIGTTAPAYNLDVSGTGHFSGNLVTDITGSVIQCVHASATGVLSGTGSDCGSGGGGGYPTIQVNGTTVPGSPASINNIVTGSTPGCIVAASSNVSGVSTISLDVNSALCPTTANVQSGGPLLVTETSASPTVYTGTMIPTLAAYTNGMTVNWLFLTSCTGGTATTVNINALGAKSLFQYDGVSNPAAGDCAANRIRAIKYVAALNSGAGAFVLDGGPSGGGGGISGLTTNAIPKATSSSSIGNSSLTDNGTTVSATEPLAAPSISTGTAAPAVTTGSAGVMAMSEGAAPSVCAAAGVDCVYADSTQHTLLASLNNGAYFPLQLKNGISNRRTCTIDNDTQSATALVAAQFSGGCDIPAASTIVEVDAWGGTGVTGGTVTTTGTGSFNLQKYTPNGGAVATLLSAALATVAGQACAMTTTSGACINGTTSSTTVTISTTALAAGDWVRVSAATPDAAQTWYRIAVIYTVN